jgi:broad specificity phosphatase PhoE
VSTLYLVRHAQASFLADDYDQLSELGRVQAERLGAQFAAHGVRFDALYIGPRRRHRQTAEHLLRAMPDARELVALAELDEYPADELLAQRLTALANDHPELASSLGEATDARARGRALDRLLQAALRDWSEQPGPADPESFAAFRERTRRALEVLTGAEGRGRNVLAVTSAGTIGALTAHVVGAAREAYLELGFMLHNSSVTEITFSAGRASLSRFNGVSHLGDPAEWTRR